MRPQTTSTDRVTECVGWIARTLGSHTWTDADLMKAAEQTGFTPDDVKGAKTRLRRDTPPLCSKPVGPGRQWVNWIGDRECPNPDRPPLTG